MADQSTAPPQQSTPSRPKRTPNEPQTSTTTPSASRHTTSSKYLSSLDGARETLRQDLGYVNILPFSHLLNISLPSVPLSEINFVFNALTEGNVLNEDGWQVFQTKSYSVHTGACGPAHSKAHEDVAFAPFEEIYKAVMNAHEKNTSGNRSCHDLTLLVHGNLPMTSDWRDDARPDATLHLTQSNVPFVARASGRYSPDHSDVVTFFEWKKEDNPKNRQDDFSKLCYAVHHKFRSDPRTTHVTGVTAENTTMRFSYFDRSAVLESDSFDFMLSPRKLIHMLLALSRGSHSDMGFDTTIRCTQGIKDNRVYEFDVYDNHDDPADNSSDQQQKKTYVTVKTISNVGRIGLRGRGTSIYAVRPVDSPDSPLQVLKDSWINADRVTEGRVLEDIHAKLKQNPEHEHLLQHFLTPAYYGFVPNLSGSRLETISSAKWANESPRKWRPAEQFEATNEASTKRRSDAIVGEAPKDGEGEPNRFAKIGMRGAPRKRSRAVFIEGPGRPLSSLETLPDAFVALHGGLKGLQGMYHAGYIHRDVSCGNIILLSRNGTPSEQAREVGVLIDLEYAKGFPDISEQAGDYRTGTRAFMATEVGLGGVYLHCTEDNEDVIPWFHNPIHDVESFWWVACWIFFHFKSPLLTQRDETDMSTIFGDARAALNMFLPLGRLPTGLDKPMKRWVSSMIHTFLRLQLDLRLETTLAFDYVPILSEAEQFLQQMIDGVSKAEVANSWGLRPEARPAKRMKKNNDSNREHQY